MLKLLWPGSDWRRRGPVFVLGIVFAVVGCGRNEDSLPAESAAPVAPSHSVISWGERAARSGIDFTYRNGEERNVNSIVESVGGGVGLVDIDADGLPDVVLPGGGDFPGQRQITARPTGVFRQVSHWEFQDVSSLSGMSAAERYSHGVAVADFDNDGFSDVLITGYGGVTLYRNNGDGTFDDVTSLVSLNDEAWSTSAAWADVNNDGLLDLYVTHYVDWSWENNPPCEGSGGVADVCPPRLFKGVDDSLFLNEGNGNFADVSAEWGIVPEGKGLGVVAGDVDLDGDVDFYVANDSTENFFYENDGTGRLTECGLIRGVAVDDRGHRDGSMGVDMGDFNGDGLPDLWVANYESEAFGLYRNTGSSGFIYATPEAGIGAVGDLFVGFGTVFGDFDGDGDEDLVVSNGHVVQTARQAPIRQRPLYFQNDSGVFSHVVPDSDYFRGEHIGRGLASGDIDQDGDLDLVVSHNNDPVALIENRFESQNEGIQIRLVGVAANRDAIGASVTLSTKRGDFHRTVSGGGSYLSQSDATLVFCGLETSAVVGLTVQWPGGTSIQIDGSELAAGLSLIVQPDNVAGVQIR